MATLDDKLLGEKLHYYCSSSEDEDEPVLQPAPENQVLHFFPPTVSYIGTYKDFCTQQFSAKEGGHIVSV